MNQQYGLVWNFPKKSAAKSNVERAWQTTVNKDTTMVQNQRKKGIHWIFNYWLFYDGL